MVASALRSGLPPAEALGIAGECTDWGRSQAERLRRVAAAVGAPDGPSGWRDSHDSGAAADAYRTLDAVWTLALDTGAPLADALDTLSRHVRDEAAMRGRLDAQSAAPRTSQRLLTLLPLLGPVLALFIGVDVVDLYLASAAGAAAVVIGLALTVLGGWWSRSMVAAALAPRTYDEVTGRTTAVSGAAGAPGFRSAPASRAPGFRRLPALPASAAAPGAPRAPGIRGAQVLGTRNDPR